MYYCSDTCCFEKGNSDSDYFYLMIVTVDLNNFRVESKCTEREAEHKRDSRPAEETSHVAREWTTMAQMARISIMINHPGSAQRRTRPD